MQDDRKKKSTVRGARRDESARRDKGAGAGTDAERGRRENPGGLSRSFSWLFGSDDKSDGGIWGTIKTVVYAVLIAVVVRTALIEPFNIPSGSMRPTLLVGDYLFVTKYSYGYSRHSLPFSPRLFDGRIFSRSPVRGDVAVFKLPRDNKTDYIKRIIGLPGDRIQVADGILQINGEPVGRRSDGRFAAHPRARRINRYIETLPGGRTHAIVEERDDKLFSGNTRVYKVPAGDCPTSWSNTSSDNTCVYTVPAGHYFMMGDNRDNSQDSRFPQVGFVPYENLVGRADFLFFSINEDEARWWEVWNWFGAIRYQRVFKSTI